MSSPVFVSMHIASHPEAEQELEAAALWYDERQPGLGEGFLEELAHAGPNPGRAGTRARLPGRQPQTQSEHEASSRPLLRQGSHEFAEDGLVPDASEIEVAGEGFPCQHGARLGKLSEPSHRGRGLTAERLKASQVVGAAAALDLLGSQEFLARALKEPVRLRT